jgi:hypothetical protein
MGTGDPFLAFAIADAADADQWAVTFTVSRNSPPPFLNPYPKCCPTPQDHKGDVFAGSHCMSKDRPHGRYPDHRVAAGVPLNEQ